MRKRVAVVGVNQETCSFNCVGTTLEDFKETYFKEGENVVNVPRGELVIGGFASAIKKEGHSLVGIVSTKAMSGGALTSKTFAELKRLVVKGIERVRGDVDAVFLALHGAMLAEDDLDTEGTILSEVRRLVGDGCFIGVTLDHHANVTRKMVEAADVMVGYETQPHHLPESGEKTAKVMLDIWNKGMNPQAALVKVPMLAPQDNFLTSDGPMRELFDLAREIERERGIVVASPFPTQPWLDAPDNGWGCLVYADSADQAREAAERLADKAWNLRESFWRSERLPLSELIAAVNAEPEGLVIVSDTGDAAFGGAPGDNMSVVAEILKHEPLGTALAPVVDRKAFEQAVERGVGNEATLEIGGEMSAGFSPKPSVTGVVKAISEPGELVAGDGRVFKTGGAALLESGALKLAVMARRDCSINHPALYERLGVDVGGVRMVVLKTGSNFQYFDKWRKRLLRADSPGATQSNLLAFDWKHMTRPIYPFDKIKDWRLKP